ncbi:MAG: PKD domain-containing protein [Flavobacteriales bacterium]|nr:PKD domain-containing protein [Flavobacteriales bacterium]
MTLVLLCVICVSEASAQCQNVAVGKPVTATPGVYAGQVASNAVDGSCGSGWNSGGFAPKFIQVDLQAQFTVNNINVMFDMSPNGNVNHEIRVSPDMVTWTLVDNITGFYSTGQLIERCYSGAPLTNVRGVRINSLASPSWIAIREFGVYTLSSPTVPTIAASGPLDFCQGGSVTLTSSAAPSYLWSNGATTQSITVSASGTYTVTTSEALACVQGTTPCTSCSSASASATVTVHPLPVIAVSPAAPSICSGSSVALTASGGSTYSWTPATGLSVTTGATVTAAPITNTAYTVTGTDVFGCVSTANISVSVTPRPVAAFAAPSVCMGQATAFTDQSSGSPVQWDWDFGDGGTGSAQNPTHSYIGLGPFTATLIVTDAAGCKDTVALGVAMDPIPVADFTAPDVCLGVSTCFADNSTISSGTIATWAWDMGDPTSGPSNTSALEDPCHTFTADGTFQVGLTVTSQQGCQHSISQTITVLPLPDASFAAADVCMGAPTLLNDLSTVPATATIVSSAWDIGNNGSIEYTTHNASHTFATEGTFDVRLVVTSSDGCTDDSVQPITVYPGAMADFSATTVCVDEPTIFTDQSTVNAGTIVDWQWDFGDGGTSTVQHPTHTYATDGMHTASLSVTTDNGCGHLVALPVEVFPLPVADFATTDFCPGVEGNLTDESVGTIVSWSYDMGDGSAPLITPDPAHTYSLANTYAVQLDVVSADGCAHDTTISVVVYPAPLASFTATDVCAGEPSVLTDLSSVSNPSNIMDWTWDVLDDASIDYTTQNATHVFPTEGSYSIRLSVESTGGCVDDTLLSVTVFPIPQAAFTVEDVCFDEPSLFVDASTTASGSVVDWAWDFGDGNTSTLQHPENTYTSAGSYTTTLTVTSDNGCINSTSSDATVHVLPAPAFQSVAVCQGLETPFTNSSTIPNGTIASYQWTFGDLSSSTLSDPVHTYLVAGIYPAMLIAVSDEGCEAEVTQDVEVFPLPEVGFSTTPQSGCEPLQVSFTDQSTIAAGYDLALWQWDFGDGSSDRDPLQNNTYLNPGTYDVTLTVTSANGCIDSITQSNTIVVHPRPEALFSASPQPTDMFDPNITFTDSSEVSSGTIISWHWDFGDGMDTLEQHPIHSYLSEGTYPVALTVQTDQGCEDVFGDEVVIRPVFTIYVPSAFTPNGDGTNEVFLAYGEGIRSFELLVFNRWGERVFSSYSIGHGWNGQKNNVGDPSPQGIYSYLITLTSIFSSRVYQYKGAVSLTR